MEGQVDRAFDRMEQNVDGYLDWYYSLTAEYVRLAKLLTGDIEGYMEQKLSEHIQKGEAYEIMTTVYRQQHQPTRLSWMNTGCRSRKF